MTDRPGVPPIDPIELRKIFDDDLPHGRSRHPARHLSASDDFSKRDRRPWLREFCVMLGTAVAFMALAAVVSG